MSAESNQSGVGPVGGRGKDSDILSGALARLPVAAGSKGRKLLEEIKTRGLASEWEKAAKACARIGINGGAQRVKATKLLADLLIYPKQSAARCPKMAENINWLAHALYKANELCIKHGLADYSGATLSTPSPYPVLFAQARIEALAEIGADPRESKALLRAAFRKSTEEVKAVLAMPNRPAPGDCLDGAASPLHRACYGGPNEVFAELAKASSADDWLSLNENGQTPLDKAYQSDNVGRAAVAMKMTPHERAKPDEQGDGPLHRLAKHLAKKGPDFDPEKTGWLAALCDLAGVAGADAFAHKNKMGLTPLDCVGFGPSHQALLRTLALRARKELDSYLAPHGEAAASTKKRQGPRL